MPLENLESKLRKSLKISLYDRYNLCKHDFKRYRQSPIMLKEYLNIKSKVKGYLESIEFPQEQVDFLKKFINLRDVDNNIKSITLDTEDEWHVNFLKNLDEHSYGLSDPISQFMNKHKQYVILNFFLYKQFSDLNEFKAYIKSHKLPIRKVDAREDLDKRMSYGFYHEGVGIRFRDSHILISKNEPVEKVSVYCDGGRVVLD